MTDVDAVVARCSYQVPVLIRLSSPLYIRYRHGSLEL